MEPTKKLYARMTNYNWDSTSVEVTDERDAVQKALQSHAIIFSTYEVASVAIGGKEMKGEPENFSPRRYIGINRVYTRDEVIQSMRDDMKHAGSMAGAIASVIEHYEEKAADSVHITGLERPGEFIELGKGEKVFDRQGKQLWPDPLSQPSTLHVVKPAKKLQLKPGP